MYDNFDAFFIVKFLNTFNNSTIYPPVHVLEAGRVLLNYYGVNGQNNVYEEIKMLDMNS
jgi:hypothetical protein